MRILVICLIMGCAGPHDPSVIAGNKQTIAAGGEYMGTLPDGREVMRIQINRGGGVYHYLYIVDDSVSLNRTEQHGKASIDRVEVLINGKRYTEITGQAQ